MNYNFEWDPKKAFSNLAKHKISFESAAMIFKDQNAISIFDQDHSDDEDRWVTVGMDFETRTLVVVHTYTAIHKHSCNIRIISARRATKKEQAIYRES